MSATQMRTALLQNLSPFLGNVQAMQQINAFILSLGTLPKVGDDTAAKRQTLKAISDVKAGKNVTHCASFEDYLKAVAQ